MPLSSAALVVLVVVAAFVVWRSSQALARARDDLTVAAAASATLRGALDELRTSLASPGGSQRLPDGR